MSTDDELELEGESNLNVSLASSLEAADSARWAWMEYFVEPDEAPHSRPLRGARPVVALTD